MTSISKNHFSRITVCSKKHIVIFEHLVIRSFFRNCRREFHKYGHSSFQRFCFINNTTFRSLNLHIAQKTSWYIKCVFLLSPYIVILPSRNHFNHNTTLVEWYLPYIPYEIILNNNLLSISVTYKTCLPEMRSRNFLSLEIVHQSNTLFCSLNGKRNSYACIQKKICNFSL